jgi:putative hydrolases of HD superfamily
VLQSTLGDWRVSFMVILLASKLDQKIDLNKALKLSIVHDLSEVVVGDTPSFLKQERKDKAVLEKESMENLKQKYSSELIDEIYSLWEEYENQQTMESKFIKALDKIEVRIQHNESNISTWSDIEFPRSLYVADKFCNYDPFLKEFNKLVQKESKEKIINESDKDFDKVLEEAEKLRLEE